MLAFSTSVPVPFCVRLPVPVMPAVLNSEPCATVSVRLKVRVPLLLMALLAESEPVVLPFPICKFPLLIFVLPVKVLFPSSTKVLFPNLVSPTAPPPAPVESAMISAIVKVFPLALVVSNAIVEPASNPPVLDPFAPPRLSNKTVTFPTVNSPVPPTLRAKTPPEAIRILDATQSEVFPL